MSDKTPTKVVAHRILLLPNQKQRRYFSQAAGTARFIYNWALAEWNRQYDAGLKPKINEIDKKFNAIKKDEFAWLYGPDGKLTVSNDIGQAAIKMDLKRAWKNYFEKRAARPKFKKKGSRASFYVSNTNIDVDRAQKRIKIGKAGYVRCRNFLRYHGKIMGARVSRRADRWFVSIQVEIPTVPKNNSDKPPVGVDLGVKSMATLSTGQVIENSRSLRRRELKIKRLQKKLSRQATAAKKSIGLATTDPIPKGVHLPKSNRMRRTQAAIQKQHEKVSNARNNAQHQMTSQLTRRFGLIAIEDLNVRGMTASAKGNSENPGKRVKQKAGLNRAILDVGFGELRRQLEYKSARTGSKVVVIDRWAPSSKTCSVCGSYQKKMPLVVRRWTCPDCGTEHDRDVNAAKIILFAALSLAKPQDYEVGFESCP